MTSIQPQPGQPQLNDLQEWELDEENIPLDQEKFIKAVQFLKDNHDWVNKHQDEAEKYFKLLAITNLVSEEAKSVHDTLFKEYPILFPAIKVKMAEHEVTVSKLKLFEQSEWWSRVKLRDKEAAEVELTANIEVDPKSAKVFLD